MRYLVAGTNRVQLHTKNWTNTLCNFDKDKAAFFICRTHIIGQIHFNFLTNTLCNLGKGKAHPGSPFLYAAHTLPPFAAHSALLHLFLYISVSKISFYIWHIIYAAQRHTPFHPSLHTPQSVSICFCFFQSVSICSMYAAHTNFSHVPQW